jgi:hypothetical protein
MRFSKYGIVSSDAKPIRSHKKRHKKKWLKKNSRKVKIMAYGDSITFGSRY